jgi:hypothetical protein
VCRDRRRRMPNGLPAYPRLSHCHSKHGKPPRKMSPGRLLRLQNQSFVNGQLFSICRPCGVLPGPSLRCQVIGRLRWSGLARRVAIKAPASIRTCPTAPTGTAPNTRPGRSAAPEKGRTARLDGQRRRPKRQCDQIRVTPASRRRLSNTPLRTDIPPPSPCQSRSFTLPRGSPAVLLRAWPGRWRSSRCQPACR